MAIAHWGTTSIMQEEPWLCPHDCGSQLACGHPCSSTCGACLASTLRDLPGGKAYMVAKAMGSAAKPAERALAFTVPLPATYKHPSCSRVCERTLHCGHLCGQKCHEEGGVPCPPCRQLCPVKCCHSKCGRSCSEPCPPCAQPCSWECKHQVKRIGALDFCAGKVVHLQLLLRTWPVFGAP